MAEDLSRAIVSAAQTLHEEEPERKSFVCVVSVAWWCDRMTNASCHCQTCGGDQCDVTGKDASPRNAAGPIFSYKVVDGEKSFTSEHESFRKALLHVEREGYSIREPSVDKFLSSLLLQSGGGACQDVLLAFSKIKPVSAVVGSRPSKQIKMGGDEFSDRSIVSAARLMSCCDSEHKDYTALTVNISDAYFHLLEYLGGASEEDTCTLPRAAFAEYRHAVLHAESAGYRTRDEPGLEDLVHAMKPFGDRQKLLHVFSRECQKSC